MSCHRHLELQDEIALRTRAWKNGWCLKRWEFKQKITTPATNHLKWPHGLEKNRDEKKNAIYKITTRESSEMTTWFQKKNRDEIQYYRVEGWTLHQPILNKYAQVVPSHWMMIFPQFSVVNINAHIWNSPLKVLPPSSMSFRECIFHTSSDASMTAK